MLYFGESLFVIFFCMSCLRVRMNAKFLSGEAGLEAGYRCGGGGVVVMMMLEVHLKFYIEGVEHGARRDKGWNKCGINKSTRCWCWSAWLRTTTSHNARLMLMTML